MLRRGMSLVEIVVAVGFLAIALVMVLSLMPAGILSLDQAEKLETATSLATMLLDESLPPAAGGSPAQDFRFTLNGTEYTCRRSLSVVTSDLYDVRVSIDWNGARKPLDFWLRKDRRS